jgi:hypothetical protein
MAGEYDNLLAGYSPEYTGAEPPRNKLDGGPSLAEMLQRYGPAGSAAMEKRGPWMREYLHPRLADFLATSLMGLGGSRSARGAAIGNDFAKATGPNGVVGGWPTVEAWAKNVGLPQSQHRTIKNSSPDLAAREGVVSAGNPAPARDGMSWPPANATADMELLKALLDQQRAARVRGGLKLIPGDKE